MFSKMLLSTVVLLVSLEECSGYLKFATYYQNHMVLQRGPQQAVVWGTSNKIGDTVTVEIVGGLGTVKTNVVTDLSGELDGVWEVKLPAISDPGPFTISASSSQGKVSINDVLFGDVWMCSGQSNMYFPISWLFDPTKTISEATKFNNIRIFKATPTSSNKLLQQLHSPAIPWSQPTQASLPMFSALCWLYAQYIQPHLKYPLGMVESSWGGTSIEAWSSPISLAKCPARRRRAPHTDNVLWNAMINPFTRMTIYGALWYQGEANSHTPDRYSCEFPAMIANWRSEFNKASMGETDKNFPFGFVQLAPNVNSSLVGGFPYIRWAQTANIGHVPNKEMPSTFMAVAMDLPDFKAPHGSIHPRYKEDVAKRLVLAGRAVAYKEKNLDFQGPFPSGFGLNSHSNQLTIEYNNGPIDVRNNHGFESLTGHLFDVNIDGTGVDKINNTRFITTELDGEHLTSENSGGLEICCSWTNTTACATHDQWSPAPITSHTLKSVTVSTTGCGGRRHFVGLRYEWHTSPCPLRKCAVYGKNNELPAPPYLRTTAFSEGTTSIIG